MCRIDKDISRLLSAFDPFTPGSRNRLVDLPYARHDIQENDKEMRISFEVPGIDSKNLNVHVADNILTVEGKQEESWGQAAEGKEGETSGGKIVREINESLALDDSTLDLNVIRVNHRSGLLNIIIPKKEKEKKERRVIPINPEQD